mmetsp:Transcript_135536/g.377462  ORF Transcript_135536/g.377462 Transcript_135536/m.377462 type:complete len:210 (+) Transcript_135536:663-1292(+)
MGRCWTCWSSRRRAARLGRARLASRAAQLRRRLGTLTSASRWPSATAPPTRWGPRRPQRLPQAPADPALRPPTFCSPASLQPRAHLVLPCLNAVPLALMRCCRRTYNPVASGLPHLPHLRQGLHRNRLQFPSLRSSHPQVRTNRALDTWMLHSRSAAPARRSRVSLQISTPMIRSRTPWCSQPRQMRTCLAPTGCACLRRRASGHSSSH